MLAVAGFTPGDCPPTGGSPDRFRSLHSWLGVLVRACTGDRELLRMRQPRLNDYAEIETLKAPGLVAISPLGDIKVDLSRLFDDDPDQPAS